MSRAVPRDAAATTRFLKTLDSRPRSESGAGSCGNDRLRVSLAFLYQLSVNERTFTILNNPVLKERCFASLSMTVGSGRHDRRENLSCRY